jgi:hypothetical protein
LGAAGGGDRDHVAARRADSGAVRGDGGIAARNFRRRPWLRRSGRFVAIRPIGIFVTGVIVVLGAVLVASLASADDESDRRSILSTVHRKFVTS